LTNSEILLAMNRDPKVTDIKNAMSLMKKGYNNEEIYLAMNPDQISLVDINSSVNLM